MGKLGFIAKHLGLLVAGLAAYQLVLEPMLPRSIPVRGDAEHLVVLVHGLHGMCLTIDFHLTCDHFFQAPQAQQMP